MTEESIMSALNLFSVLDLSTAHLRQETCDRLNSYEGVIAHRMEYGWLMYVSHEIEDDVNEDEWPSELTPIVKLARDNDCAYILFDRDADTTDLLQAFDW
jgi:hypothetical protein